LVRGRPAKNELRTLAMAAMERTGYRGVLVP